MRRRLVLMAVLGALLVSLVGLGSGVAQAGSEGTTGDCVTIPDGTLLTSDGEVITTGYDQWGYNYQGHIFNGGYCDAYRDAEWCQEWAEDYLIMKWNDAWLSNKDCDGDGLLDRHYGFDSYVGSGAWETNVQFGEYVDDATGEICSWNYFVKIVAVPEDATLTDGTWYIDGAELGPAIWGEFAVIQEVYTDPCGGYHGLLYLGDLPRLGGS